MPLLDDPAQSAAWVAAHGKRSFHDVKNNLFLWVSRVMTFLPSLVVTGDGNYAIICSAGSLKPIGAVSK